MNDIEMMMTMKAQISAVHRELYKVICQYGEVDAVLKSSIYFRDLQLETFPTVGDFVEIEYNPNGPSRIIKTLERKTYFSRKDPDEGKGEQAVAANFDYVFIVTSMNYDFNVKRMERYLTVAWQSGAQPVIILTKADLVEDFNVYIDELEAIAIGVDIIPISSKTGYGLEQLEPYVKEGKTIVFLGSSGVGKSSLLNALAGDEIMETSGIREDDSKGHHTTTHRQLIRLKSGAVIIDTPGMRELGMWDISVGLGEAFGEIEELILGCKFSDCTHKNEPGCKINEALESGMLQRDRWERYLKLKKEARYSENKEAYFKAAKEAGKSYAKFKKSNKNKR
ncbi:MAG: ribosome small subunit-dependent GTPase A [Cellulosilyticum sp.]|nr:ribosome small subunit-dependent GTPase A [Cellulosilyticum sp.]